MSIASPNFDDRPAESVVDMLVFHYTGMESAKAAIDNLCSAQAKVSAHYLIDEDGAVQQLVDEEKRAWHAGEAWWGGEADINARSIGIELVNPGHEFGYRAFPEAQMAALEKLALDIMGRRDIPAQNVVGHADVAPRRKQDPGELFDWSRLAAVGIGLWPGDCEPVEASALEAAAWLSGYGYETLDMTATITAFQRHFCPEKVDGIFDNGAAGRLSRLLKLAA